MTDHPALTPGRAAVITGAASGIGLATARRLAAMGMRICLADLPGEGLNNAAEAVAAVARGGDADVRSVAVDVSREDDVARLRDEAYGAFGEVAVLMNNAGIGGGGRPWENLDRWRRLLEVNLMGMVNGVQAFVPRMLQQGTACAVINTGSKQGITNPPGDAAYNVTKAAVKALTEQLAHELRAAGGQISAHLLIPGYTFTGLTAWGAKEKPPGAWSPEQVADFLIAALGRGDFYILCPDNEVTRAVDERRIRWAAEDLILNRPALSRWHPDYKEAFAAFMAEPPDGAR